MTAPILHPKVERGCNLLTLVAFKTGTSSDHSQSPNALFEHQKTYEGLSYYSPQVYKKVYFVLWTVDFLYLWDFHNNHSLGWFYCVESLSPQASQKLTFIYYHTNMWERVTLSLRLHCLCREVVELVLPETKEGCHSNVEHPEAQGLGYASPA